MIAPTLDKRYRFTSTPNESAIFQGVEPIPDDIHKYDDIKNDSKTIDLSKIEIPELIIKVYPKMSKQYYLAKLEDPAFFSEKAFICVN